jgi:SAM-dependent methyltransferase
VHPSAMARMQASINTYLDPKRHYDLLDFGSFINEGQHHSHRELLTEHDVTITGVDIQAGRNVDIQMKQPYRIPVPTKSQDVVLAGQVFEHIPFPFASMLEIARVLRPGGYLFMTVPSRGHHHSTYDCWRYYPDSMRALAAYSELELLQALTDWPPAQEGTARRHDYAKIDLEDAYWGDTSAVFRKPKWRPSPRRALNRWVSLRFANGIGDLSSVPRPKGTRLKRPTNDEVARRIGM